MDPLYRVVLSAHIAFGFMSLGAGGVAFAAVKGSTLHRGAGTAFFWAMVAVSASAFVLAVLRPNRFLFMIAVFSLYLVFAGRRAAVAGAAAAGTMDIVASTAMILAALGMTGWGALDLFRGKASTPAVVLIVFGGLGGLLALQDFAILRARRESEPDRITRHLARMTGGLIAAVTAFMVVNATMLPELVRWLAPTALGVPVIIYWSWRVKRAPAAAPQT